jgi:hypothetical protein
MPTIAELKAALKAKGIKGYSGKRKAYLEAMLAKGGVPYGADLLEAAIPKLKAALESAMNPSVAKVIKAAKPIAPHATPVAVTATAKAPVRKPIVFTTPGPSPELEHPTLDRPRKAKKEAKPIVFVPNPDIELSHLTLDRPGKAKKPTKREFEDAKKANPEAFAPKPTSKPVGKEVTAYNTPWVADAYKPSAWIKAGSKIIVEAIRKATKMLVDNPTALDGFKNIQIPISSLVDVVPGLKGQPIDVTAMGTERMGQYDSPIVSFSDAEDGKIDCRLGIHWTMKKPIQEDKPGEAWYGTVRLYVEYYPKSMGKKNKWNSHVRAEYERSDDEELDDKFEEGLKKLVEENKDHRFTFDVPRGKEALKIAEKIEFTGFSR